MNKDIIFKTLKRSHTNMSTQKLKDSLLVVSAQESRYARSGNYEGITVTSALS